SLQAADDHEAVGERRDPLQVERDRILGLPVGGRLEDEPHPALQLDRSLLPAPSGAPRCSAGATAGGLSAVASSPPRPPSMDQAVSSRSLIPSPLTAEIAWNGIPSARQRVSSASRRRRSWRTSILLAATICGLRARSSLNARSSRFTISRSLPGSRPE